jgi:sn-glycerol 3-phosphate transport system substrate-binding protein
VLPLDAVAEAGGYYPTLLQPEVGGHIWGIPFQRSTVVLYYNETAFAKAGLNPEDPPQTRVQLVADAEALQKAGYIGIEIPTGGTGTNYWQFQPFAVEYGQNLVGTNGTTVYFNSPAAKDALNFWMELSHTYKVEPTGLLPWQDVPGDFESGKVGMIVHSSGSMAAILKNSSFSVGVAFMPKGAGRYRTVLGGGDMYLIKGTPPAQQAAGLTFIKWMTSPAQIDSWSISTGYVPTTPKALSLPAWTAHVAQVPQAKVAVAQLPYAAPEMSTYQLSRVTDIIDSAIDSVVDGSTSAATALNAAETLANGTLAPYRNP